MLSSSFQMSLPRSRSRSTSLSGPFSGALSLSFCKMISRSLPLSLSLSFSRSLSRPGQKLRFSFFSTASFSLSRNEWPLSETVIRSSEWDRIEVFFVSERGGSSARKILNATGAVEGFFLRPSRSCWRNVLVVVEVFVVVVGARLVGEPDLGWAEAGIDGDEPGGKEPKDGVGDGWFMDEVV